MALSVPVCGRIASATFRKRETRGELVGGGYGRIQPARTLPFFLAASTSFFGKKLMW